MQNFARLRQLSFLLALAFASAGSGTVWAEPATAEVKIDMKTVAVESEKKAEAAPVAEVPVKKATEAPERRLSTSDYLAKKDVRSFIKKVSTEKGIPVEWLEAELAVARYSPLTEKYSTPKPNADRKTTPDKNFRLYRRNLVNEERIARGVEFLKDNKAAFDKIEARTGVSRYAIAAVIGVETIYGKNMGRFRVLDALMTLSFDYTRRAKYYRGELASFLDFCWQQKISPVSVHGSFAGAIGLGQFMPSSLEAYGRDGNDDGHIDIVKVPADGIASVANFLKVHGWVEGREPIFKVEASEAIFKATKSGGIKTHLTVAQLREAGVKGLDALPYGENEPVMLIDLPRTEADSNKKVTEWYVGTRNFAAILRYNRSYFYASAVSMLAEEIRLREEKIASANTQSQKNP